MNRWREIAQIQRDNGVWWCDVVNAEGLKDSRCTGKFDQSHHAIFKAEKSHKEREWRLFLDHPINHASSCVPCNVSHRVGDPEEARYQYFLKQIERYGQSAVKVWLMLAPVVVQGRHDWQRMWTHVSGLEAV